MRCLPALLAAAACLAWPGPPVRAAVVEEIVAWVNGQIITRSELLEREQTLVAQFSARLVGDELDRELEKMRATLLTDMIRELLLLQRAEILGLELDKVYSQAVDQLKEQQGIKTNEELDKILEQEGITKEELRDTLLRFNVPEIMVNLEVRDKIGITDREVADFYQRHKDDLKVQEEFSVREIVVTREGRTDEELAQVGAAIQEELKAGTSFNELVIKHSQAPSRFKEGLIGPFKRGDLAPALEVAALALQPGGVSEPILTHAGLHLLKLESHTLAKDLTLEEARTGIVSRLKQQKFQADVQNYFKMLLETNRVEVNPNYKQYDRRS
ncbi:MAG TPA: peptidylprolyl isomerase [Candidatus Polarisedimenticolia bacterium]|nr:peptidylprolyl isomerase [Candidatus Polarisedimenticolia bacterium]